MSANNIPAGFRQIHRLDGIFQEQVHDAYKAKAKLHEPSVCSQCGAFFHRGNWRWGDAPPDAHHVICPACHRLHDHFPAGFLKLEGPFFLGHKDEIMRLVQHHAQRERAEHPLQRIMAVEDQEHGVLVTTTDIHLARGIGEAVHHAYQGELEFHYNPEENLLRVQWSH